MIIIKKKWILLLIISLSIFVGARLLFNDKASDVQHQLESHLSHDTHERDDIDHHTEIELEEHIDEHDEHTSSTESHKDEVVIKLSAKAIKLAGIEIKKVKTGRIQNRIELMGEVGYDEDRLADIVPRFPGIVKRVAKKLGDHVKAGETLAEIESNESLSVYKLKSLIPGTVVEKHITLGEFVSDEMAVYRIADLNNVWINLAVYTKDIENIRIGQKVSIKVVGSDIESQGTISYTQPVFSRSTRSFIARVVLLNYKNKLYPGMFVKAEISSKAADNVPLITNDALQVIDERSCVFIPHEPGVFKPINVKIGRQGIHETQILSGLSVGDAYVGEGAFELKAKMVTSALGSHAGHGH